jgi:phosphoglycolate phosphatase-like HAD superfamily hydrolase
MKNIVLFFDFDGVILDSHEIREAAFRNIFSDIPKHLVDRLIIYHRNHGGISRYAKISWFYNNVLGKNCDDELLQKLSHKFSVYSRLHLSNPDLLIIPTINFIKKVHQLCPLHIITGADEAEIINLCRELDILRFFQSVRGSPTPKNILLAQELANWSYTPEQVIMIGDSITDYNAAYENDVEFYGYNNLLIESLGRGYIVDWNLFYEKLFNDFENINQ